MGTAVFADIAVTQNFQTVDRFLLNPGTPAAAAEIRELGRDRVRALLRRNAGEENNFLLENGERAQLALAVLVLAFIVRDPEAGKAGLGIALGLLIVLVIQHFFLSPQVAELGRRIELLPASDPLVKHFWMLHGFYSGLEILKLLAGAVLAVSLCRMPRAKGRPAHG